MGKKIAFFVSVFVFALQGHGQSNLGKLSAKKLYERITGTKTVSSNPQVMKMQELINQGELLKAAEIATAEADFLNVTVKAFALKMSTKEETVKVPLNDFTASFIGVARDNTDARELLYGDFYYRGAVALSGAPLNIRSTNRDLFLTNNHYDDLERQKVDLSSPSSFVRVDGQVIMRDNNTAVRHQDAAGVLTSRSFIASHASGGTNRRIVEYTFREFMCTPLLEVGDTGASDARVGRDVTRTPSGDHAKYTTNCKGCHTVMDGFRGAFAKYDFEGQGVLHSSVNASRENNNVGGFKIDTDQVTGIATKMAKDSEVYPYGYVTMDDSFENNALRGINQDNMGWRSSQTRGNGAKAFGKMFADSKRFSQCMAKRIYEQVCHTELDISKKNKNLLIQWGDEFEKTGYNLKDFFARIAVKPEC